MGLAGRERGERDVYFFQRRLPRVLKPMKTLIAGFLLVFFLSAAGPPLGRQNSVGSSVPPLERRIGQFDIQDAILRDGIAELSSKSIRRTASRIGRDNPKQNSG